MPKLILMFKEKILEAYPLAIGDTLTIGRNINNVIVIDNLAVSGSHAAIRMASSGPVLSDTGSKNGTLVNNEKISECVLYHNDAISVGKHIIMVDLKDETEVPESALRQPAPAEELTTGTLNKDQTMAMDTPLREECSPVPESHHPEEDTLFVLAGGEGDFNLSNRSNFSIGRNPDADIVVGGLWGMMMGSPAAVINKRAGDYFLRFAGGFIKPKRNGAGVKGTIKLNHEDIVSVGPIQVQIQLR